MAYFDMPSRLPWFTLTCPVDYGLLPNRERKNMNEIKWLPIVIAGMKGDFQTLLVFKKAWLETL